MSDVATEMHVTIYKDGNAELEMVHSTGNEETLDKVEDTADNVQEIVNEEIDKANPFNRDSHE